MAIIEIDADLENSDWTKQTNDLPSGKELEMLLESQNISMAEFKKLPAYYLPKQAAK